MIVYSCVFLLFYLLILGYRAVETQSLDPQVSRGARKKTPF